MAVADDLLFSIIAVTAAKHNSIKLKSNHSNDGFRFFTTYESVWSDLKRDNNSTSKSMAQH